MAAASSSPSSSSRFSCISFSGAETSVEKKLPSWRNPEHSDWEVVVGERKFQVHKVILARSSQLLAECVSGKFSTPGVTDLTELLPSIVQSSFEIVLDYMYDHKMSDRGSPVVMLAAADILGMRGLFDDALVEIEKQMRINPALMLLPVSRLPKSDAIVKIRSELVKDVSATFKKHASDRVLHDLPEYMVYDVLVSDSLKVGSEDEVAEFLMDFYDVSGFRASPVEETSGTDGQPELSRPAKRTRAEAAEPPAADSCLAYAVCEGAAWNACRLVFLTLPCLMKVRRSICENRSRFPTSVLDAVNDAAYARNVLFSEGMYCGSGPCMEFLSAYKADGKLRPRVLDHIPDAEIPEIDFVVQLPTRMPWHASPGFHVSSPCKKVGRSSIALRIFPGGTKHMPGKLSAFVLVSPAEDVVESSWQIAATYAITIFPWKAGPEEIVLTGSFTFRANNMNGWHDVCKPKATSQRLALEPYLSELGFLWMRLSLLSHNYIS